MPPGNPDAAGPGPHLENHCSDQLLTYSPRCGSLRQMFMEGRKGRMQT